MPALFGGAIGFSLKQEERQNIKAANSQSWQLLVLLLSCVLCLMSIVCSVYFPKCKTKVEKKVLPHPIFIELASLP